VTQVLHLRVRVEGRQVREIRLDQRHPADLEALRISAVLFEAAWNIAVRHVQPARVPVADVEDDQAPLVLAHHLSRIVDGGRRGEAVHHAEGDLEAIEHRLERAADGALLRPHFDPHWLRLPLVLAVGPRDGLREGGRVIPRRHAFHSARLVGDPRPRDDAVLPRLSQEPRDALGLGQRHARDHVLHEELVADGADTGRVDLFEQTCTCLN
jgi:hypothetical protein